MAQGSMTQIARGAGRDWVNEHRTHSGRMEQVATLSQSAGEDLAGDLARRREVLGNFIEQERVDGHAVCVTGSSWSQSLLHQTGGTWLDTEGDAAIWNVPDQAFRPGVAGRNRYVMVAGGTKVKDLLSWLDADPRRLSLATAGSHKGQSVAGMLATGSHGSMLDRCGFECHVAGMLISTGKGAAQWLAAEPVLRDDYVTGFAAIGDPAHFPAALVHLGGMGVVSALLLKLEDDFRLGRIKRTRVLPQEWAKQCAAGDFTAAVGAGRDPAFYEVTLDPFRGAGHEVLETIWFRNDSAKLAASALRAPASVLAPDGRHVMDVMSEATDRHMAGQLANPAVAQLLVNQPEALFIDVPKITWDDFKKSELAHEPDATYRLSQLVGDWKPHQLGGIRIEVYNAAFAVPLERLPDALAIGFKLGSEAWRLAHDYVFTVRFARRSNAAMGFLRFENNAIINIDGLAKNFPLGSTSHKAALELARRFETAKLPFAMHWGKDAPSDATKIARDFGTAVAAWQAARADLLGDRAPLFRSPALEHWGLV